MVITGNRNIRNSAVTRTNIDSITMAQSREGSLADMLGRNSPIFVKSMGLGSSATVSFRGTAASHTTVEWNGIGIANPMMGQVDFSLLPVGFIDRAELLHGGSSLQQGGGGALGGAVIVGSLPRWDRRLYGAITQSIGSFGTYRTFATVGGGNDKVHARVRYLWEMADNDFSYINTAIPPFERTTQKGANYRKQGATADIYLKAGRGHTLALNLWYHYANRNLPAIMSYEGAGRNENQQDDELRMVLHWNKYGTTARGQSYKSELVAGYSATTMNYIIHNRTDTELMTTIDSRSRAQSLTAKYAFDWDITHTTLLRLNVNAIHHSVGTLDHIKGEGYDARRTELGFTASVHHRFSDALSGYLLLRQEAMFAPTTGSPSGGSSADVALLSAPFIPSLGLELAPLRRDRGLTFRLNATRNYHQPTLNDLYWLPGGNADLAPERGVTADLAAEYSTTIGAWNLAGGVTAYGSLIDNWIVWRPGEYSYWRAENLKKVFARGLESRLRVAYAIRPDLSLALSGNYTYTRTTNQEAESEFDASQGRQLIYIPEGKAAVSMDVSYRFLWLSYQWSYTGERYTNSSNEPIRFNLPAYDLHDVAIGANLTLWKLTGELQLRVNNIFNKDYQAILWRAMPGRNYNVQLNIKF